MSKKEVFVIASIASVLVGGVITYIYMKKHNKDKKPVSSNSETTNYGSSLEKEEDNSSNINDICTNYSNMISNLNYKGNNDDSVFKYSPYVISPEDYEDPSYDDYDRVVLTYYKDNILARNDDEVLKDPESYVGPKALSSFGMYEEDTVYVRDDMSKLQYEIDRDLRPYTEVVGPLPESYYDDE